MTSRPAGQRLTDDACIVYGSQKPVETLSTPPDGVRRSHVAALALACVVLLGVSAALLSGFFRRMDTFGAHDWDQMTSYRYLVVKSFRQFGQFPFWDPYGCGGFPFWGAPESGTTVISPFLPVYLALPLGAAIRFEVVALVLTLVAGCWFFARKYVTHPILLAFVCLVGALNSRTALQAAVGHVWHLYYAGLPWVLAAFDRAYTVSNSGIRHIRVGWFGLGAAVFALMIYDGGIYPVPHTAMCLVGLAAYRAYFDRDWRRLLAATGMLAWGALLAMPKLLPVAETMSRFPRLVESRETIEPLLWLHMFAGSVESFPEHRAPGLDYLWHEYGQYIGIGPLVVLIIANICRMPPSRELRSLRFVGWFFMALSLGGAGPWVLLHMVPIFRSQHVPSRFTYPAFLLFAVVAANALEQHGRAWAQRRSRRFGGPAFEVFVVASFLLSAALIGREDARCTWPWFALEVPTVVERSQGFAQYADVPTAYLYGDGGRNSPRGTNGAPGLLIRRANVGAIRCGTSPGLNHDAPKGPDGRPLFLGARGIGDAKYRGEYWLESAGQVDLIRWSPNEVVLSVRGASPGELLVLNQNWAPGWSANGQQAVNVADVNGYRLANGFETVTFRYRPRTLGWGLFLFSVASIVPIFAWAARRTGYGLRHAH